VATTPAVLSIHTPQSTHMHFALSTADSLQPSAAQLLVQPGVGALTLVVSSARLNPRTCIALSTQIHCSKCAAASLVQPEREWLTFVVSACTRLNPRTCIAFVHRRFTAAQCSASLGAPEHEWLRRSLLCACTRLNHTHMHLPSDADSIAAQCSTVLVQPGA
jgi:hypothetical protein